MDGDSRREIRCRARNKDNIDKVSLQHKIGYGYFPN